MKKTICGPGGEAVVTGAQCQCDKGTSPGTLTASQTSTITAANGKKVLCVSDVTPGVKVLCVSDVTPGVNVTPFGSCNANPPATPPCTPALVGMWLGDPQTFKMNGIDILTRNHKITCSKGGIITINSTGQ